MSIFGNARGFLLAVAAFSLQASEWVGIEDFQYPFEDSSRWEAPVQEEGQASFLISSGRMVFSIPEAGNHTAVLPWKKSLPGSEGWYVEALCSAPGVSASGDLISTGLLISAETNPTFEGDGIVMRVENQVLNDTVTRRLVFEEKAASQVYTYYDQTMSAEDTTVRLKFQYLQSANLALFCFEDSPGVWLCVAAKPPKWTLAQGAGLQVAALATSKLTEMVEEKAWIDDFYIYTDEDDKDSDGIASEQESELGTNPYSADTDEDGLTDSEEIDTYDTDPLLNDSDQDSYPDGLEVQAGEDPKVRTNLPALLSPVASTDSRSLQIQTFPGLTYQVQYSSDLQNWTNQGAAIVGTGNQQSMDLGVAQDSTEFYRIRVTD